MRESADIQIDLDAAYEARRTAMQAQSYSLDTGQGKQSVNRASLNQLNDTIKYLQDELEEAIENESGYGGLIAGTFRRF
jgi:hypothetical protein